MLSIIARGGGGQIVVPLELETPDEPVDALIEEEVDVADVPDHVDEDVVELCALPAPDAVELCDVAPPTPASSRRTKVPEQPA
jgi:hypothetical protein